MSVIQQLAMTLEPWKTYYADHDGVSTAITAIHVAAIVIAGGLAIAADRMTLRVVKRASHDRALHIRELHDVHRPVIFALIAIVFTGLLMAASDVEEFTAKPVFWIKMGLIAVMLINGLLMQKAESRVMQDTSGSNAAADPLWSRLSTFARVSMVLWITITIAGVVLAS